MPISFEVKAGMVGKSVKVTLPKPVCDGLEIMPGDILVVTVTDHEITVKKKD